VSKFHEIFCTFTCDRGSVVLVTTTQYDVGYFWISGRRNVFLPRDAMLARYNAVVVNLSASSPYLFTASRHLATLSQTGTNNAMR